MNPFETFLWSGFPWLAAAAFIIGVVWRWRTDQFGWTSHSSQIYESRILRLASPLFHWGMMFVIIGHLMGLAIPKSWTTSVGVSETAYHLIATIPGTIAGIAVIVGLVGLIYRRVVNRTVFLATSRSDKVMYLLLGVAILSGFTATVSTQVFGGPHGYDYRETISPWLRQIMVFQANPDLMADVPWEFKVHVVCGFSLIALWPFTRLVHAFSAPVGYVSRPYIVYRSRDARTKTAPRREVAWEQLEVPERELDRRIQRRR
ncbi:respiratory nitrate reductase subunit gamma [Corynebacterium variabile]|uniref:respiratory nitrate reductase subunit gamma n=1 Tax=Corynebacterium variabile TaxID=1727 RepID=UPI003A93AE6A